MPSGVARIEFLFVVVIVLFALLSMVRSVPQATVAVIDANFLLYLEYTDALKYVADHDQGKVVFMDNGAAAPARVVQAIAGMDAEPQAPPPRPQAGPPAPPTPSR
jgi:hypothetical protein